MTSILHLATACLLHWCLPPALQLLILQHPVFTPRHGQRHAQAAAAFVFFNFLLSMAAVFFAVRAVEEVKAKQREEYGRMAVLSDNLQFESDHP
jgi:Ca2+/H+ antiporter